VAHVTDRRAPSADEEAVRVELERHVHVLAAEIGERSTDRPEALEAAARHIENALAETGLKVAAQEFEAAGRRVRNIEAVVPASSSPARPPLVVGAHYDSAPACPGANDNASGVAALIVLARRLAAARLPREVRLVAFVNEEDPHDRSEDMGSVRYAGRCRERGEELAGMIALETIGYYDHAPRSQAYPYFFSLFYPRTADFVALVGNVASRRLLRGLERCFRGGSDFPTLALTVPGWLPGVGASDHWSFWREGYPAVMVTDTANFRYRHFHAPTDLPAELRYPELARVTSGLAAAIAALAADLP
jgi:Zn-dependent M28 family amino/carboxypeptidase